MIKVRRLLKKPLKNNRRHKYMKKYKQYQLVEDYKQAYNEGTTINNFINTLEPDLYKVNNGTLETINIINNNYIQYDFRSLFNTYKFLVGSGYYNNKYGKINDDRIGKRKLYQTTKGYYFIENGIRCYLNDYITYKRSV